MPSHNPQPVPMHENVIRQFQHERAELIDRLSRTRAVLAFEQGVLEADKLVSARSLGGVWSEQQETRLNNIRAILAEGLFGDDK